MRSKKAEDLTFAFTDMKTLILATAVSMFLSIAASGQTKESLTLNFGKQKTASKSKLKVKFVSVVEDSRCPVGVNCIWAGNAKVKVKVIGAYSTKEFEFNTGTGAKGAVFEGWSVTLDNLTPEPQADKPIDPKSYKAKFNIIRMQR